MRKLSFTVLCCILFLQANSGVYRHDVDVRKYKDLAAEPQFDCAGQVINSSSTLVGSCVLIGDRYVLCAAHVFVTSDDLPPDTTYINGHKVIINKVANRRIDDVTNYAFRFKHESRKGKVISVHPIYRDSIIRGRCDIAVIELDEPITGVKPAVLHAEFDELHCIATGVGWGASGKANEPENVDIWFEEIAGQNMIDTIGGFKLNGMNTSLMADFDAPGNKKCNKYGSADPLPLEYMTAGGDSGGGLFRQNKNNGWELIGICTGGGVDLQQMIETGYYGQKGTWTRVSVLRDWIIKTMKEMR